MGKVALAAACMVLAACGKPPGTRCTNVSGVQGRVRTFLANGPALDCPPELDDRGLQSLNSAGARPSNDWCAAEVSQNTPTVAALGWAVQVEASPVLYLGQVVAYVEHDYGRRVRCKYTWLWGEGDTAFEARVVKFY